MTFGPAELPTNLKRDIDAGNQALSRWSQSRRCKPYRSQLLSGLESLTPLESARCVSARNCSRSRSSCSRCSQPCNRSSSSAPASKSGNFLLVKHRHRLEAAHPSQHMASRKSLLSTDACLILAGCYESTPKGVLLSGAGLAITSPRFPFASDQPQQRFFSQWLRDHTSIQCSS